MMTRSCYAASGETFGDNQRVQDSFNLSMTRMMPSSFGYGMMPGCFGNGQITFQDILFAYMNRFPPAFNCFRDRVCQPFING